MKRVPPFSKKGLLEIIECDFDSMLGCHGFPHNRGPYDAFHMHGCRFVACVKSLLGNVSGK